MSIEPTQPSGPSVTPPPIKPEKQHPITKMFQKVCTFVRSPIQTLRGRTVTRPSVPIISQKKLGEIKATLERKYGITPSNKNITSLEELVNDIKDQTPTKSFLDTELGEDEAGRIIMAAHLLREGESASVGDSLKRAQGRFHRFTLFSQEASLGHFSGGIAAVLGGFSVPAGIALYIITIPLIITIATNPFAALGLGLAAGVGCVIGIPLAVGGVTVGIGSMIEAIPWALSKRFVKKWEGTDPQVQKIQDVSKKMVTGLRPYENFKDFISKTLHFRIFSKYFQQPIALPDLHKSILSYCSTNKVPIKHLCKTDSYIDVWKKGCEEYLLYLQEQKEKIENALVIPAVPRSVVVETYSPSSLVKTASELKNNLSNTIESLTKFKDFLDPSKDTEKQKLQLDWHTKDWKMIRKKLADGDFDAVMIALSTEKERISRGDIFVSPFKENERLPGYPFVRRIGDSSNPATPFKNICNKHLTYLDTISKALKWLHGNRLKNFLENTSAENSFNALIEIVNTDLPDSEKIDIPEIVNEPVPENLMFDWSYTRYL